MGTILKVILATAVLVGIGRLFGIPNAIILWTALILSSAVSIWDLIQWFKNLPAKNEGSEEDENELMQ